MDILVGADPEFFLKKDGKFVSAYGIIPGTKKEPHKVEGGAVQVDGMAIEFNIDPASTADEFVNNINTVLAALRDMIPEEYEFCFEPVADFGQEYIDAQPLEARELGCDPDFNIYTGEFNEAPNGNLGIRTAAGHIHVGWTNDMDIKDETHIEACTMMTQEMDYRLGLCSPVWDFDRRRASMYGHLGTMRVKPYGVEYRTLSNAWLNEPKLWPLIFYTTVNSFRALMRMGRATSVPSRQMAEWDITSWVPYYQFSDYMEGGYILKHTEQPYLYPIMGLFKEYKDDDRVFEPNPNYKPKKAKAKKKKSNAFYAELKDMGFGPVPPVKAVDDVDGDWDIDFEVDPLEDF